MLVILLQFRHCNTYSTADGKYRTPRRLPSDYTADLSIESPDEEPSHEPDLPRLFVGNIAGLNPVVRDFDPTCAAGRSGLRSRPTSS